MYTGLLHLHSTLRWIILILLLVNIIRNYSKINEPFTAQDKKLGLFLMIAAHLTLTLGLIQWAWHWLPNIPSGVDIMTNEYWRFYLIEHPVGMIIGIILITIGKGVAKKDISDHQKHKRAATLFLIALIIILATIPWPFRGAIGRSLVP
jgi:hypothetical protein